MEHIIKNHLSTVRAIIYKITGSQNPDLEQEVFIKIWRNHDKYTECGKYRQWISALTANLCRDYFKNKHVKHKNACIAVDYLESLPDDAPNAEVIYNQKHRQKLILKQVNALPSKLKQVIVLYEFEGMSYMEIALKLSVSVGTIKSRLFTARAILSEKLHYLKEN